MPKYYSEYDFDRETATLDCACGWQGPASEASSELFDELYELQCPRCDARLAVVSLPTHDQVRDAAATGNERAQRDLVNVERIDARRASASRLALTDIAVLPDFDGPELIIHWDQEKVDDEQYTVLLYGGRVLWRELAFWEGLTRYEEVVALLELKYGTRLRGVIPTKRSELYLGGDKLYAFDVVDRINARLASAGDPQEEPQPPPPIERLLDALASTRAGFEPFTLGDDGEGAFVRWRGRALEIFIGDGTQQLMTQIFGGVRGPHEELMALLTAELADPTSVWHDRDEAWLQIAIEEPITTDALRSAFEGIGAIADYIDRQLECSGVEYEAPLRFDKRVKAGPVAPRPAS